jgi:hypothetical protein
LAEDVEGHVETEVTQVDPLEEGEEEVEEEVDD